MDKNIQFLFVNILCILFLVLLIDFEYMTKFMLWFVWSFWSTIVAIEYAIIWRESVQCNCLEKEK